MVNRRTLFFFSALSCALAFSCSKDDPDDDTTSADAGPDASTGGGRAGTGGGTGGSRSSTGGTGSGTAGSGGVSGTSGDGGSAGDGSSSDGGPSGNADGGVADGGTTDAGTTDAGVSTMPGCAGLMQCCGALMKPERMSCELLATNADDAMCDQLQILYCMPEPGSGSPGACTDLDACCETLPRGGVRVACATTVMNDVLLDCEQLEMALCPEGGDPNACEDLTACCGTLPPPQRASCNMLAAQGLAASCEAVLPVLCP